MGLLGIAVIAVFVGLIVLLAILIVAGLLVTAFNKYMKS